MSSKTRTQLSRTARLLKDLKEIEKCPVANVAVAVQESNLCEWHVNISGEVDSVWFGTTLHCIVTFPEQYPLEPPHVEVCTFFKHLNVQRVSTRRGWEVCLDMLTTAAIPRPYSNWSSAFTARALLVQLSSFLLAPFSKANEQQMERARTEALNFKCQGCGHCHEKPHPVCLSVAEVEKSPLSFPPVEVSSEATEALRARRFKRMCKLRSIAVPKLASVKEEDRENLREMNTTESKEKEEEEKVDTPSMQEPQEERWITVTHGNRFNVYPQVDENAAEDSSCGVKFDSKNNFDVLDKSIGDTSSRCILCKRTRSHSLFSSAQLRKDVKARKCKDCLLSNTTATAKKFTPPTTTTSPSSSGATLTNKEKEKNKNWLRREKRRRKKAEQLLVEQQQQLANGSEEQQKKAEDTSVPLEKVAPTTPKEEVAEGEDLMKDSSPPPLSVWNQGWGSHSEALSLFAGLPKAVTAISIMQYLGYKDIVAWGSTCKAATVLSDDWWIWRRCFTASYPRSALRPMSQNAWKHCFILEANHLAQEPTCFFSRVTRCDVPATQAVPKPAGGAGMVRKTKRGPSGTILGIPIVYTINPKTKCLDYVDSTFDILSYDAFVHDGVRTTAWGESFQEFLPLYLDPEHFARSLKILRQVCVKITGDRSGYKDENEAIVEVIAKMMNTQVVLLCDKGLSASAKALTGYCQLHRLLLAIVGRSAVVRKSVRSKITAFVTDALQRTKEHTKSLGVILPLLSVSDTYGWKHLGMPYFFEAVDRSILWACAKDESLAVVKPGDKTRLKRHFDVTKVSRSLLMFHSCFLDLVVKGGGSEGLPLGQCVDNYDLFLGRPPKYLVRQFQDMVKRILAVDTWSDFFEVAKLPQPTEAQLLKKLEDAVENSIKKGYHKRGMDFSRLHRSGVSTILRKGESYAVSPNIKRIHMLEKWRYEAPGVIYLDASCLVYSFENKYIGHVDYALKDWEGCIRHSGDMINYEKRMGTHTIDVDVKRLPPTVGTLFFTVSAWTTPLKEIKQPSVHLEDAVTKTEMCSYQLEEKQTGEKTAVIMCSLRRSGPGEKWKMNSIGKVTMGRAGNYDPIREVITSLLTNPNTTAM